MQTAMKHLEEAVSEIRAKMAEQKIPPQMARELIERFHRIEKQVCQIESDCLTSLQSAPRGSC